MASRAFRSLESRAKHLGRVFLPAIKPSYSLREYDRTRAYLVLCHAEVEHFLELRASGVVTQAKAKWDADGRARSPLLCLMGHYHKELPVRTPISARLQHAIKLFEGHVGSNHGVKEINVLRLLLPIGVALTDLDPLWLADMETFGTLRGSVAHTSARAVSTPPDPNQARLLVGRVISGLESVDASLVALVR
jgi:hypothetical protein